MVRILSILIWILGICTCVLLRIDNLKDKEIDYILSQDSANYVNWVRYRDRAGSQQAYGQWAAKMHADNKRTLDSFLKTKHHHDH